MATESVDRPREVPLWAVAVGGVLTALAFPMQPDPTRGSFSAWPLVFVSLAPFLARLLAGSDAVRTSFVFAVSWFFVAGVWAFRVFDAFGWVLIWLPIGWLILFGVCARQLHRARYPLLLAWPAAWLAVEFLRSEFTPLRLDFFSDRLDPLNFTWFGLGHPRLVWPRAAQSADLIGGYGLALAPFIVNLLIAIWWVGQHVGRPALVAAGLFLALDAGYCEYRWREAAPDRPLTVGVVQSERYDFDLLTRLTEDLVREHRDVRMVVWPELAFPNSEERRQSLQEMARTRSLTIVTGVETPARFGYNNGALIIHADGCIDEVPKRQRVPFVESHPASDQFLVPSHEGHLRVGVAICYDMDFPRNPRLLAAKAQVLAMPTLDDISWGGTQHAQHALMPRLRAIETRRAVVQAATSGYSQILDARGQLLSGVPFRLHSRPGRPTPYLEGTAAATVSLSDVASPYMQGGYRIPAMIAGLVGVLLLVSLRRV
ncbi:MAG: hypothetical protein K1X57_13475 [Gemmataceae bacterium]|nr:hypothetical protein [Gemmataceae bacterium]